MSDSERLLEFGDDDLKEIFALLSSVTLHELNQSYDPQDPLFFQKQNLDDEYELSQGRRDFAIDAVRAVLYYLYRHGFGLHKAERVDDLKWVSQQLFVQA